MTSLFIPAPTLAGTFGAVIRIESPIPDRRALLGIGVAGSIIPADSSPYSPGSEWRKKWLWMRSVEETR